MPVSLCVNPSAVCSPLKGRVSLIGHRKRCLLDGTDEQHYHQTFLALHQLWVDYRTCHFALLMGYVVGGCYPPWE